MRKSFLFLFVFLIYCNINSQNISKNEIDFVEKDKETGFFRVNNKNKKYGFLDKDSIIKIPLIYDFVNPFNGYKLAYAEIKGNKLYIDTNGNIIIPPEYEKLELFSEGLVHAKKKEKYGFLDTSGKIVIPFIYDSANYFYNGLAQVSKNGKYGFINSKGQEIIPIAYESAWSSQTDSIVLVSCNNKWAFVDNSGRFLSDFIYDKVLLGYNNIQPSNHYKTTYFKNGAVLVIKQGKYEFLNEKIERAFPENKFDSATVFDTYQNAIVKKDGKYGMIRSDGEIKIPLEFDEIKFFDKNHLSSEYYNAKRGKVYSIINRNLKKVGESYEPVYNDFSISNPTLRFKNLEGRMGIIDWQGNTLIPFEYDNLMEIERTPFLYGQKGNFSGIVSTKGEVKIPIKYKEIYSVYDRFDDEEQIEKNLFIADGTIIDINNNVIIRGYDSMKPIYYNHNKLIVSRNKKFGIIYINKKVLLPLKYSEISNWVEYGFTNRHLIVKNGKYGMIESESFKTIIPPIYDSFVQRRNLIFVSKNGKAGIIDSNNGIFCPFIFDEIKPHKNFNHWSNERMFYSKKIGKFYHIEINGNILKEISEKEYRESTEY